MNLLQLAWSYLRARPLGTLLNVAAAGARRRDHRLRADRRWTDRREPQPRRAGDRPRGRSQGQPDPADARRDLSSRRADRQHPAQVRAGARQEPADPARDSAFHRRQLSAASGSSGTTPDYIDLYHGAFASGQAWNDRMQAVLGATVAARTGLRRWRPLRRLARPRRRRTGARRFGLHGGRRAEARPGAVLDRLVLVNTESVWFVHEGNYHRSGREEGNRGRATGHRAPGAVRDPARRRLPAAQDQCRDQHAGRIAGLRDGAALSHDWRRSRRDPRLWRRRARDGGAVAVHRALPRAQRARLRHRRAANAGRAPRRALR